MAPEKWLQTLLQKASWPIFFVLVIAVVGLWILGVYLQLPIALGFLAGTVVAIVNRYRDPLHDHPAYNWGFPTTTSIKLGYLIFLWLFIAAAVSLRVTIYTKPVAYYLFVAVAASLLVVLPKYGKLRLPWFCCVIGLGAIVFLSNQMVYPFGFGGADSYYHISQMVQPILENGTVPQGTNYSSYALHHIFVVSSSLFLDIPGKQMYYYSLGIVMLISGIWVFLFVRTVLYERKWAAAPEYWASLALVVFVSSDFINRYTNNGNHLTYTGLFIVMILTLSYILVWSRNIEKPFQVRVAGTVFFLFATITVTHHYSVAILLFLLFPLLLVAPRMRQGRRILIAFSVIVFIQWTYNATTYGLELVIANIIPLFIGFDIASPTGASMDQPIWLIAYTTLGISIAFAIVQIGILDRLEANIPLREKVFPVLCYAFLALMAVGVILGIQGMSPNRMLFFSLLTFVPLFFVLGIRSLQFRRPQLVTAGLILIIAFFALSGLTPSIETSPVSDDVSHNKKFETYEESEIVDWYRAHQPGNQPTYASRSFVEYDSGTVMFRAHLEDSQIGAEPVPLAATGEHYLQENMTDSILLYSEYDERIGYRPGLEESRRFGEGEYATHAQESVTALETNNRIYDSGVTRSYRVNKTIN